MLLIFVVCSVERNFGLESPSLSVKVGSWNVSVSHY